MGEWRLTDDITASAPSSAPRWNTLWPADSRQTGSAPRDEELRKSGVEQPTTESGCSWWHWGTELRLWWKCLLNISLTSEGNKNSIRHDGSARCSGAVGSCWLTSGWAAVLCFIIFNSGVKRRTVYLFNFSFFFFFCCAAGCFFLPSRSGRCWRLFAKNLLQLLRCLQTKG